MCLSSSQDSTMYSSKFKETTDGICTEIIQHRSVGMRPYQWPNNECYQNVRSTNQYNSPRTMLK